MDAFQPRCLPTLIGSMPHESHGEALELIFRFTPEIPVWPQLPSHRAEGMLVQFLPGMPGVVNSGDKVYIDTGSTGYEEALLSFFEEFLTLEEGGGGLDGSRFAMSSAEAAGFFAFLEAAGQRADTPVALKGQLTGPVTFATGLVDQQGRALFYDDQLRDAAVKLLAMKARYQTRTMAGVLAEPLVFLDEPGLAGFGSSAFITITPADIKASLNEVFASIRAEGGRAGVHVCANTEWPVVFDTEAEIVSFDAYSYFDKLILFADELRAFLARGGVLAYGIVPTSPDHIERETADSLYRSWCGQVEQLEAVSIAARTVVEQSLITPSCGLGTVTEAQSLRVLELTREVSERIRAEAIR